jgi:ESX secretion system ATPase EccB
MTMQSRRDLFHAYRLMTQRASLALLRGEPDIPDQPLRRLNVATFSGVLVGIIAMVGFLIWGLLGHNGSALQKQAGILVLDQATGQSYVFCGNDLCPAVNYASARLALASDSVTQQTVSQASLDQFPRGPLIGIPGLPPLPGSGDLVRQPWSVCTQSGISPGAGQQTTTSLSVDLPTGGSPLRSSSELLVQVQGQSPDWVIWDGQRLPIQHDALDALTAQSPTPVPSVWLNALPEGRAFAAPAIPGRGQPVADGPASGPAQVGQTYQVPVAGGTQYYVLLKSGLATITQTQDKLLQFLPGEPAQTTLTGSEVTAHTSNSTVPNDGLPASIPAAAAPDPTAALCVVYTSAAGGSTLTAQVDTGGRLPPGGVATGASTDVDQVALPAGKGALVGDATGTGQHGGTISYFLVTAGRRYALSQTEVAGWLGYDPNLSQAVLLPAGVVDLIPSGPALDPAQANKALPSGG